MDMPLIDEHPISNGPTVMLPNGNTISATHAGTLDLPHLSTETKLAYKFPHIQKSLLSLSAICNEGGVAIFSKHNMHIIKNGKIILKGTRDTTTGLWLVPLSHCKLPPQAPMCKPSSNYSAAVIETTKTKRELVRFLHASCFFPVKSTWIKAIRNGNFATFPGLTVDLVSKYLPVEIPTILGHQHRHKQGIRSTTAQAANVQLMPEPPVHEAYIKTIELPHLICTDQTGKFPIQSRSGNNYLMILYDYDANAILGEPIPNRESTTLQRAFMKLFKQILLKNYDPTIIRLDNEVSKEHMALLQEQELKVQLVPPHNHRQNLAERAIQTYKNHFIAGLSGADPSFPLALWDTLIPQANLTLNLLRSSRINPKLSAHAQIFGQYDYNATPIAPPGCKCIMHESPTNRLTWAVHGTQAYYTAPALKHYRCYEVHIRKTLVKRITDNVTFLPHNIKMPATISKEAALDHIQDLIKLLKGYKPHHPLAQHNDPTLTALDQLQAILTKPNAAALDTSKPNPENYLNAKLPRVQKPPKQTTPQNNNSSPANNTIHNFNQHDKPTKLHQHRYNTRSKANRRTSANSKVGQANAVLNPETGKLEEYRSLRLGKDKHLWIQSFSNELGRLTQGVRDIKGTDCITFIKKSDIPKHKKIAYARIVCSIRPQKKEPYRTRMTIGGNLLDYAGNTKAPTADLVTMKLLLNSVLSTPGARFMTIDIKNFYLETKLKDKQYMVLPLDLIPNEIIEKYNLNDIAHNGNVYMQINKGIYGLKEAGALANEQLQQHLAPYGYTPSKYTPGLWKHNSNKVIFTLVVDDFGVKYIGKDNANHLIKALKDKYEDVEVNWEGDKLCGITLRWNYDTKQCKLSLPGYIDKLKARFNIPTPTKPQLAPADYTTPTYGRKQQLIEDKPPLPRLSPSKIKRLQEIIGTCLYYCRVTEPLPLVALSTVQGQQVNATDDTNKAVKRLLEYLLTFPNGTITYTASDMILWVHSDGAYLVEPGAKSRVGGHFFLSDFIKDIQTAAPKLNGPIHNLCKILRNIVSSAAECEIAAAFENGQEATVIRRTLEEMGHPQPPTPIQVDNTTAKRFIDGTLKENRTKSIDMKYHWLKDRQQQRQFNFYWKQGKYNLADPFTKNLSAKEHTRLRKLFRL